MKLKNIFQVAFLSLAVSAHAASPTIAPLANETTYVDHPILVEIPCSDAETPANLLSLTLTTSNPALVTTNRDVLFRWFTDGGPGYIPRWYLTLAPTFGQTGTTTNTITVSDGTNTARTNFVLTVIPPPVHAARFANTNAITLPNSGVASQYPSTINVSGMSGTITNVVVTLSHLTHTNANDLHMLLVSPTGQKMVFWSKVGGGGPLGGTPPDHHITNVTATITDDAPDFSPLPQFYYIWTEKFRPADYATIEAPTNNFPAPAPGGPYPAVLSSNAFHQVFQGLEANGTWSLYIYDDASPYGGRIDSGWSLTVSTTGPQPPTITDIAPQTIATNMSTAALPFIIADPDTAVVSLTLSNASSNPVLVPTNNIVFGGSGSNRTVTVTPAPGQTGTSTIGVFVSDGTNVVGDTFLLTVLDTLPLIQSFTNTANIVIRDTNSGNPYPSTMAVTGFNGVVSNITVTLRGFDHTYGADADILLVSPTGQKVMLMSDCGVNPASNVTLTLSDAAPTSLPATNLVSGTFRPTNLTDGSPLGDNFPAPAPTGPYGTALSAFTNHSPNGSWSLYVFDDGEGDTGNILSGWSMTIGSRLTGPQPPTITPTADQMTLTNMSVGPLAFTIADSDTPIGSLVLSNASSNPTLVPTNNIVFGGSGASRTVTVTPVPGQAGIANITLFVSDGTNTASDTFMLTVVTSLPQTLTFSNGTPIVILDNQAAFPYPSSLNVSGMNGAISNVTITLHALSHEWGRDIDALLVGPGGQKVMFMSDAGTGPTAANANFTFSDGAAGFLNAAGSLVGGTYKPTDLTNLNLVADVMPAPAPAGPYATNLFAFNGQVPNGPWSLYVIDDGGNQTGRIAGGWSLTISTTPSTNLNTSPTISAISGQVTLVNTPTAVIPFTIGDAETAASNLTLRVFSSNTGLVPTNQISLGGTGSNLTVTVTPAANQLGTATISMNVSDGSLIASNSFLLTVNPAPLTVTENSFSRGYGATNPVLTGSIVGLQAGDNVTATFTTTADTNSPVGTYPIAFTLFDPGSKLGNYIITTNNGTLTVTNALLTVTASSTNKIYGATRTFAGTEFVHTGTLFNNDTLTNVTLASTGANAVTTVGSYPITITNAVGLGLANYAITYSNGTLAVTPAALTVTANNTNKVYGATLNPTMFGTAGLLNGDSVNSVTLSSAGSVSNAAVGSYPIIASGALGAGLANYTIGYSSGALTVGAANLLITAGSTNKVYGATLNPAAFSATGLLNSDSVTNVTLNSAGSVSNAPVGSYAINSSGALGVGLNNYSLSYSNGTLMVTPAVVVATADNQNRAYGQPNPVFTISYSGFVNGEGTNVLNVLPSASSLATSTTAPGSYPITVTGGSDNNYVVNTANGTLTITAPAPVMITTVEFVAAGHLRIAGVGDANVNYKIEASANLTGWTQIGTAAANGSGTFEYVDEAAGGFPARYYRVATP